MSKNLGKIQVTHNLTAPGYSIRKLRFCEETRGAYTLFAYTNGKNILEFCATTTGSMYTTKAAHIRHKFID